MPEPGADLAPGWLVDHGIGETRALLVDRGGGIIAARLSWPGEPRAGQAALATLTAKRAGARRGVAVLETGGEVLVDHLPPAATEGARIGITITRAPMAERGRLKRAQARCTAVGSTLADTSAGTATERFGEDPFARGATARRFPASDWDDVWHAASSGSIAFAGGEVLFSVTPAMTVIDIDGDVPPRELALRAIPAIARGLRWFDLGGNIGIDFPTIEARADRRAVDEALGEALAGWPHERTAMNGFGFVQVVARLEGPSLLHRFATSRTGMCARHALFVAGRAQGTGRVLELRVHPALKAKLKPGWLDELARRTGREVRLETDPGLALEAASAQIVTA
ncbi:MAG: ribonuclease [Erythrobacter sp.]